MPRTGRPRKEPRWRSVDSGYETPCWEWLLARNANGYGVEGREGRITLAHRLAYEDANGPIPDDRELDHLCRNRACVNPDHLEAVTHRENLLRSPVTMASRLMAGDITELATQGGT